MLDSSRSSAALETAFMPSCLALSTIVSVPGADEGSTGGSGGSSVKDIPTTDEFASDLPKSEGCADSAESTKDVSFEEGDKPTLGKPFDAKSDVPDRLEADTTMAKPTHSQPPVLSGNCKPEFEFPTASGPRSCSFGGGLCELMVVEAIQEFLTYHGMDESLHSLNKEVGAHGLRSIALVSNSGLAGCAGEEYWSSAAGLSGCSLVGCELSVGHALACFDSGSQHELFKVWEMLVPASAAKSSVGCALGIRLRVHFGVYATRSALKLVPAPRCQSAESEGTGACKAVEVEPIPEPDLDDLKAFLALNPSANLDQSAESLAPLFALPFVPQPHTRPGFKFIFEDIWVQKLRMDLHAFLLAHATARRAPMLRHLAGALVMAKGPKSAPPPASWHELVRIADLGLASAARVRGGRQGSAGGVRGAGARAGANFFKDMVNARCRLAAVAAKPDVPPPVPMSAQQQVRTLGTAAREICDNSPSRFWSQRAGSAPCLDDVDILSRRDLIMSPSRRPPSKRLQSARGLESRARTATAVLPMPPALDFARIAAAISGKTELGSAQGSRLASQDGQSAEAEVTPPLDSLLRALLRRIALPDEPVRPRRTFLAAFACFGALRALTERLPEIVLTGDAAITELALAVLAVCTCEAVGRKEIEQAEMGNARCIVTLVEVLERKSMAGPVHIQCLAVLQRLSLRRRLQSRMIAEGAIDWVLQALRSISNPSLTSASSGSMWNLGPGGDEPGDPDFMLEFASALLMNLMLRAAGRRRCVELNAYEVLVHFIQHPNAQVRTHVNGTLYSLLGVSSFRESAKSKGAEASFRAALNLVPAGDALLRRQLEFLLVQLTSGGSHESDENEDADAEQGAFVEVDDGDNFLIEEELAGHFLLVSSAACAATAEDAAASVAGAGGNMAVERTAAEAAAVSQAAAAQAAAAEEALRRFRVSPLIADAQQRLFHAFIASTCAGLNSPASKRRNRWSLDSAGSPNSLLAAGLNSPSPPPAELSPISPLEPKCLAAAPSEDLPTFNAEPSNDEVEAVPESSVKSQEAAKDGHAQVAEQEVAVDGDAQHAEQQAASGGNGQAAEPASATGEAYAEPSPAAAAPDANPGGVSHGSRRHTTGGAAVQPQRGATPSSSRGSSFSVGNPKNKRSSSQANGRVAGGGRAASKPSSQPSNIGASAGSDRNRGAGFGSKANRRANTSSPRPSPSLPHLVGPGSRAASSGEHSERPNRSMRARSLDGKAQPSKAEVAKAASTTADAVVTAGIGRRIRSKPTSSGNGAAAVASMPLRTSNSTPHLPPLIAERRST